MIQPAVHLPTNPAIDPVCGMKVDPAKSQWSSAFAGTTYYFCCDGCRDLFAADPVKYLNASNKPAHRVAPHHASPDAAGAAPGAAAAGYTCPMHPEVLRDLPGTCPICGMALEPRNHRRRRTRSRAGRDDPPLLDLRGARNSGRGVIRSTRSRDSGDFRDAGRALGREAVFRARLRDRLSIAASTCSR